MHRHKSTDPSSVGITIRDNSMYKLRYWQDNTNQSFFKGFYLMFLTTVLTLLIYFTTPAKLPSPDVWLSENPAVEVNSLRFSKSNDQWGVPTSAEGVQVSSLKIVSWNVYKKLESGQKRLDKIISVIESEDPDIVCLQELSPSFVNVLKSNPYIQNSFYIADDLYEINYRLDSSTIIMSKLPITKLRAQTLWSGYHKMALMSELLINEKKFAVLTFQLEPGLHDQLERWGQVKILKEFVKDYDNVIFAGDFQFTDYDEYDEFELYNDAYAALKGNAGGFTYDPIGNPLLKEKLKYAGDEAKRSMRRDLVIMKGEEWSAKEVKMLGEKPVDGSFVSTHFGLAVTFMYNK